MRKARAHRSAEMLRSVTLLRTFVATSAAILAVGAVALSSTLTDDFRASALQDSARDVSAYTDAALAPSIVRGHRIVVTPVALRRLGRTLRLPDDVRGVSVYSRAHRLVFSTTKPGRVRMPRTNPDLEQVLRSGLPTAALDDPPGKAPRVVTVWAPLLSADRKPVGATEVTLDASRVDGSVEDMRRTIWIAVVLVFGALWLALAVLVKGASWRLRRQNEALAASTQELRDTAREVEAALLETIETLNAAVEARDPYTAGHSQRVRRVSLAIGRELGLSTKQLGALSTAALFHDVGKIGMPDAILTKPDILTRAEAAVMREHVVRGAEIVGRIASLGDAVPAIRHHHERWDGLGYPDGLSEDDIPMEAAIIAIADAWDAMTTDRPYADALDVNAAMHQLRMARGKQFHPAVVDAFWAIARRRPAEILPPSSPTAAVIVV